jgi:hypothetical protein
VFKAKMIEEEMGKETLPNCTNALKALKKTLRKVQARLPFDAGYFNKSLVVKVPNLLIAVPCIFKVVFFRIDLRFKYPYGETLTARLKLCLPIYKSEP